jgi:hypothetical protein
MRQALVQAGTAPAPIDRTARVCAALSLDLGSVQRLIDAPMLWQS